MTDRGGSRTYNGLGVSAIADRALIADAKEKARAELSGGTRGSSGTGLDTLNKHSGTPQQHPHLRVV